MDKKFDTYKQIKHSITPEQNVYLMFVQVNNGEWHFKGLVSEKAKNTIQSDDTIERMNENYENQKLFATFTKKPIEETKKMYLFVPCPNADVSVFYPVFKSDEK